jgi:hypothetical protein
MPGRGQTKLGRGRDRGERLRAARMRRFRSARSAAIALAIPISTYGAHERAESPGGRDYGPDEARRYAKYFGVTPEWLLVGNSQPTRDYKVQEKLTDPPGSKLSIVGYIGSGGQVHLYAVAPQDLEQITVPILASERMVALENRGNSIGRYFKHWFLLYSDLRQPLTTVLKGQLCIIALKDGRVVLTQWQRGAQGEMDLLSTRRIRIPDATIEWAARVEALVPR